MWTIHLVDVKSAFLQGKEINANVYVKPPQEPEMVKFWKLKTNIYGPCDAPRVWYLSVKGVPLKAGAVKEKFDDSCHVDYFFWGGTKSFQISVINALKKSFVICQEESQSFKYVGLNIVQRQECIYFDQQMYTDKLKEVNINTEKRMSKENSLTTEEAGQFKRISRAIKLDIKSDKTRYELWVM